MRRGRVRRLATLAALVAGGVLAVAAPAAAVNQNWTLSNWYLGYTSQYRGVDSGNLTIKIFSCTLEYPGVQGNVGLTVLEYGFWWDTSYGEKIYGNCNLYSNISRTWTGVGTSDDDHYFKLTTLQASKMIDASGNWNG